MGAVSSVVKLELTHGETQVSLGPRSGMFVGSRYNKTRACALCFRSEMRVRTPKYVDNFVLHILSSTMLNVAASLTIVPLPAKVIQGRLGGNYPSSGIFMFDINDNEPDIEKLHIETSASPTDHQMYAYVFHEDSQCIRPVIDMGGCVSASQITECAETPDFSGEVAKMTLTSNATIVLSASSQPSRATGRWFVVIHASGEWPRDGIRGNYPETSIRITHESESGVALKLFIGSVAMAALTITILVTQFFLTYAWNRLLIRIAMRRGGSPSEKPLWPSFPITAEVGRNFTSKFLTINRPQVTLHSLLWLLAVAFVALAYQNAFYQLWWRFKYGDRDICFYNERCYYPAFGFDLPWNNVISHIPYWLCGLYLASAAIHAKLKSQTLVPEARGVDEMNIKNFYAIGLCLCCEGLGSLCYHLCQSNNAFQFDTCFMIPIAHLMTTALFPENLEGKHALAYLLFVLLPCWCFNSIFTWFQFTGTWIHGRAYWMCFSLLMAWALALARYPNKLTKESICLQCCEHSGLARAYTYVEFGFKCFALVVLAIGAIDLENQSLAGVANTILLLSCVYMFIVTGFQLAARLGAMGTVMRLVEAFRMSFLGIFIYNALSFFVSKTTLVVPGSTPSSSRLVNANCVIGPFDKHDVWHMLSAVVVCVYALVLLDATVQQYAIRHEKDHMSLMKSESEGRSRNVGGNYVRVEHAGQAEQPEQPDKESLLPSLQRKTAYAAESDED